MSDPLNPTPQHSQTTARAARRAARREKRRSRTRRQRWTRRVIGGVSAVVLLAVAAAGVGWWYINYRLGQVTRIHVQKGVLAATPAKPGAPFNVMLVGSDTRSFVHTHSQSVAFGNTSTYGGQRSDVLIIARFVPATKQIYLLSIPRDLWVHIPGHVQYISGMNRINASFNEGPGLLIKTVKQDFGISISHFAEVNFPGFERMVTSVGGIRIDFPMKLRDYYSGLSIQHTGCQLISGGMALAYVRSRHLYYYRNGQWNYDGMSDWSRILRQDVFFHALLAQVKANFTNPLAMNNLLTAAVHNLAFDSTLTNSDLVHLALEFRSTTGADIHNEVLPTIPTVINGMDVLLPAMRYDRPMIRKFLSEGTGRHPGAPKTASTSSGHSTSTTSGHSTSSGTSPSTTSPPSTTTTTTTTPPANVVFDTQSEPWNGTPC